ncbi:MAG: hypothetical protein KC636_39565, partial [Myxococcales bacterium]|nr:hypothetical protein [Myxococcales bacterium]
TTDATTDADATTGDASEFGVCPEGKALFAVTPIDLERVHVIIPMGSTFGGTSHTLPTQHIYLNAPFHREGDLTVPEHLDVPVYAPADMTVTVIEGSTRPEYNLDGEIIGDQPDFSLHAQVCDDVKLYFHHLNTISETLRAATGDLVGGAGSCREEPPYPAECAARIDVRVAAGEQIGTAWRLNTQALDWGLFDARVVADVANPDRYAFHPSDDPDDYPPEIREAMFGYKPSVGCPLDYLADPALEEAAKERLGGLEFYSPSFADPPCGTVNFDLVGTARGLWFRDDGTPLALINHHVNPGNPIFSIGAALADIPNDNYTFNFFDEGRINRRFEDVGDDEGIYCWEGLLRYHEPPSTIAHDGRILLSIAAGDSGPELTFEFQESGLCGDPASWEFGANAHTLRR